ncbi:MAG: NAD(P)H-dependent glycerol-3-phosphate dehydrogenase [Clostridiales bacterium]|jgi:glycerol-3-phosphate dehydrogenase (NAD(P)+)|nr:NAD(P)H-dependent glycerol-3-phosphate dehydrogenase [Eubacteriales bacterium]MDH7566681.1 NAD(P)H-dependent glycerol-3-phosphate dehydrogenase [Clostridiales bacterium]
MKTNISIIGAGSWGTALSILLCGNGHSVKMWSCFEDEVQMINQVREHTQKLPGVSIPESIVCTSDLEKALAGSTTIILVTPSQTIRENARTLGKYLKKGDIVVCCSKGLEEGTGLRLSQVIGQEIPQAETVVLSGPSHAEEVARNIPTAVVAASANTDAARFVQNVFMSPQFRVYTNYDIVGVELGGALKNIIALCAGVSDGLGFGDNTKAALMTRGIAEISRLGVSLGANQYTFAGLSGIGDLIVTCTSMHSRNRRAGILIGQGKTLEEALDEVKMVVEGVVTTRAAFELAKRKNISMPITTEAYNVLFKGKNAKQAVVDLMMRDRKSENDKAGCDEWL